MRRRLLSALILGVLALAVGAVNPMASEAQEAEPLAIGAVAPDFSLPGATRYGVMEGPIRLSDFKGKTVVLAFFFKARTGG